MNLQHLIEMAPPPDWAKQQKWYHGTTSRAAAKKIWKDGIRPRDVSTDPDPTADRPESHLVPMAGKVYLAPSPKEAVPYAIGGMLYGHKVPEKLIDESRYGYLFVIYGEDLRDIEPDEDGVGEMIHKALKGDVELYWLRLRAAEVLQGETFTELYGIWDDETEEEYEEEREEDLLTAVEGGEYASWARAGKLLIPHLDDEEILAIIGQGANVAHEGSIIPREVWKFDKLLTPQLTSVKAFFELAKRIR